MFQNCVAAIALTMTVMSTLAMIQINSDVEQLLDRTAEIEDRILVKAETLRELPEPPPPLPRVEIVRTSERIAHEKLDVFCLAKNIFHEAGVEDQMGKYAVAQVTLNRIKNPKYPTTVCTVVMDPYQFSWANDRKVRWTRPRGALWQESLEIAENVLIRGYRVRGLERANYYHADYVRPKWKDPQAKIAKIGTHIFYRSAL